MLGRPPHEFFSFRNFPSRAWAAIQFSARSRGRTDHAALAALHFWNYLDRLAVFFQSCRVFHHEATGWADARQSVSGVDVARHGLVSLVGSDHRSGRAALLLHDSFRRRAKFRQPRARIALVRMVGGGLAGGIRPDLSVAVAE